MNLTIISHEKSCTFECWNSCNILFFFFFDLGYLDEVLSYVKG